MHTSGALYYSHTQQHLQYGTTPAEYIRGLLHGMVDVQCVAPIFRTLYHSIANDGYAVNDHVTLRLIL